MSFIAKIHQAVDVFSSPQSLWAMMTWPKFSVTSYGMATRLKKQGINPKTILDVGANSGQFAVAAAKIWSGSKVHSFEPIQSCVNQIERYAKKLGNISVHGMAIGDEEGTLKFNINQYSLSSSALPLSSVHKSAFPDAMEKEIIEVPVNTLTKALQDIELSPPVLLKVDVQGYEAHVIRGAAQILAQIDYVLLETSFTEMYEGELVFEEIRALMTKNGFRFLRPVGWLTDNARGEILQMDALFVRDAS